jgi:GTP-binding protein
MKELLLVGCSNSGKSSLINQLQVSRQEAAKTSKKLGKTQTLDFFRIGEEKSPVGFLVDSPGYGFTSVPIKVKQKWRKMMIKYIAYGVRL